MVNITEENIFNKSKEVDPKLFDSYLQNRNVDDPAFTILIVMYSFLIIMGALGNTLVIISVVRKPTMRTPRNMFILNLAVSDFLLCTITMPLTLMEIITKYFPLGNNSFFCKIIGTMQAMSTFVSTISITAIALDRYQVIVYPTKENLQIFGAVLILLLIWVIALMLALPLFIFKQLKHYELNLAVSDFANLTSINFCIENWPHIHGRAYYSIFSMIFLYFVPIIIITGVYLRISYKLRYRFASGFINSEDSSQKNRRQLRGRRLHRTNILLSSISIIFFISWMPLNLFNLVADIVSSNSESFYDFTSQNMTVIFAVCHLIGMSSACSNPILYGCLNDNFLKEFKDILGVSSSRCMAPTSEHVALRKQSKKSFKQEGANVFLAVTDCQQGNTVDTDLSVLTKS